MTGRLEMAVAPTVAEPERRAPRSSLRREPKGHGHPRRNRLRFRCARTGGLEAKARQDVTHGGREQFVIRLLHDHARDVDIPELVHHDSDDHLSFADSGAKQWLGEARRRRAADDDRWGDRVPGVRRRRR